ncbi:MAG: hypothetical protein ACE5FT_03880 [Candidatus Nanoarchaeia archaeon]
MKDYGTVLPEFEVVPGTFLSYDDDTGWHLRLKKMFSEAGHELETATNKSQFEFYIAQDLVLPNFDGIIFDMDLEQKLDNSGHHHGVHVAADMIVKYRKLMRQNPEKLSELPSLYMLSKSSASSQRGWTTAYNVPILRHFNKDDVKEVRVDLVLDLQYDKMMRDKRIRDYKAGRGELYFPNQAKKIA